MSGIAPVEVVYAEAGRAWRLIVPDGEGLTVADVLALLPARAAHWPSGAYRPAAVAIFGREVDLGARLSAGDRLELLRPLPADPKQARRERAATKTPR